MKRFMTSILRALAFITLTTTVVGCWSAPKLMAASKAALVQSVDEPGRNPYQEIAFAPVTCAVPCQVSFSKVPVGKRLVITSVTGRYFTAAGSKFRLSLLGVLGPERTIPVTFQGTNFEGDLYVTNQTVLVYYEAGEIPNVYTDSDAPITVPVFAISGYYVNLP
jgi:hypothetical protein